MLPLPIADACTMSGLLFTLNQLSDRFQHFQFLDSLFMWTFFKIMFRHDGTSNNTQAVQEADLCLRTSLEACSLTCILTCSPGIVLGLLKHQRVLSAMCRGGQRQ